MKGDGDGKSAKINAVVVNDQGSKAGQGNSGHRIIHNHVTNNVSWKVSEMQYVRTVSTHSDISGPGAALACQVSTAFTA